MSIGKTCLKESHFQKLKTISFKNKSVLEELQEQL